LDGGALSNSEKEKTASTNGEAGGHATQSTASQIIDVNTGIGFLDHVSHVFTTWSDERCSMLWRNMQAGHLVFVVKETSTSMITTPPKTVDWRWGQHSNKPLDK
jgi:hypothetical protein